MSAELELKSFPGVCDNNNVAGDVRIEVTPGNGANEVSPLLSPPQGAEASREEHDVDGAAASNESVKVSRCEEELQRVKRELNEVVVWKLTVWMLVLIVFSLIALIIGISIIVCAVGHDDEDEKYDRSSFVVARFFRGNFTLASNRFTSNALAQTEDAENLLEQLRHQLTAVYSSSPALARFFSNVTIDDIRNSTAQFELQFNIPSENQQLVNYTLSREVVQNVLLQHFYDQEPDAGDPFYVIPTSLRMEVGQ